MNNYIDFNKLWQMLFVAAQKPGHERRLSMLKNYETSKERICRKLGVINIDDVHRVIKIWEKDID